MNALQHAPPWARLARSVQLACLALLIAVVGAGSFRPVVAEPAAIDRQTTEGSKAPVGTTYRKVFVPAENVEAWPTNGRKFLPIESREFDRWVTASAVGGKSDTDSVAVVSAQYSARWEDGRFVDGRGRWRITSPADEVVFLPLPQMSLLMRDMRWQDSPDRAVRFGYWGRSGEVAADYGLEVLRSASLEFAWNATVTPTHDGYEIPWRVPPTTRTTIILDLPQPLTPKIEGGVVVQSTPLEPTNGSAEKKRTRWKLACNLATDSFLRIVDANQAPISTTSTLAFYEKVAYRVSNRGLNIVATWNIEKIGVDETREIAVALPAGVQLLEVTASGEELSWRIEGGAANSPARAIFKIPFTTERKIAPVVLHAWQPATFDKPWRLPKLKPDAAQWMSGDLQLAIDDDLELQGLMTAGCVQTAGRPEGSDVQASQLRHFDSYAANSSIEVILAESRADATIQLGASLTLADQDINGRLVTDWQVEGGKLHRLSGTLTPGWTIDAVETIPADVLGEWFVDTRGEQRRIEVQLTRALSAGKPVSVTLIGRLPRSNFTNELSHETLNIVDWHGARETEHLLAFEAPDPNLMEPLNDLIVLSGDDITAVSAARLNSIASPTVLFDLLHAPSNSGVKLTTRNSQIAVDIRTDATLVSGELQLLNRLEIVPIASQVEQVIIYSTQPLGDNVAWFDEQSRTPLPAEQLPPDDLQRRGLPATGELWLVRFARPTITPITVMAQVDLSWPRREVMGLLCVPDAIRQTGQVILHGDSPQSLQLEPRRLVAMPVPVSPAADTTVDHVPAVAAYRYLPQDCVRPRGEPRLWIRPADEPTVAPVFVNRVEMDSYFAADGGASHEARYYLQNEGSASFDICFPAGATPRAIAVDGRPIALTTTKQSSNSPTSVAIPRGAVQVSVSFDSRQEPLSGGSSLAPPRVEDLTLLSGSWKIHVPSNFSLASDTALSWRERLFGPLARSATQQPFQPLEASNWRSLLGSLSRQLRWGQNVSREPGWQVFETTFVGSAPAPQHLASPMSGRAWVAIAFLLSAVAGDWIRNYGRVFAILMATAACLAFALPAVQASIASAVLLGLLISLLIPRPRPEIANLGGSTHWHRFSTVGVSVLLIAIALSSRTFGQTKLDTSQETASESPAAVYEVLIPVDSQGRPVGTRYYVSEEFARLLLRNGSNADDQGRWLLKDLAYSAELGTPSDVANVAMKELVLKCDIQTLARDMVVALPLNRNEAEWQSSAMLDGVPVPVEWQKGGTECFVKVPEPGDYTLLIAGVPRSIVTEDRNVVSIRVPVHHGAMLQVNHAASINGLTASGATLVGTIDPGVSRFQLADSGNLNIQWPVADATADESRGQRVTVLEWLVVRDDAIELIAKYVVEGDAAQADELALSFDTTWNFIPDKSVDATLTDEGSYKTAHIKLPVDSATQREIALRWRLARPIRWGNLIVPGVRLMSSSPVQVWRAISTSAGLDCSVTESLATSGTAAEFLAKWGGSRVQRVPQVVLANVPPSTNWNVALTPRQIEPQIKETLFVSAEREEARVHFQSDVDTGGQPSFYVALRAPSELAVDEITVRHAGQQVPVRSSRVSSDRLNVFFGKAISGNYQLTLRGSVRVEGVSVKLPLVGVASFNGLTTLQLYRGDDLDVQFDGLPESEQPLAAPLETLPTGWSGRHVAGYRVERSAAANLRAEIQPTRHTLEVNSITTLQHGVEGWSAVFQSECAVKSGVLDTLLLHVPTAWSGPYTLDSSVPASISMVRETATTRTLAIRFAEPLPTGANASVTVLSPLFSGALSTGLTMAQLEAEPQGPEFVRIPNMVDGQPATWNEAGLQAAELPKSLDAKYAASPDYCTLRVVADAAQISIQPRTATTHVERVRLADTVVISDAYGGSVNTTKFVVEASGLAECTLRLPEGSELVSVRLSNQPALLRRESESEWRVALGPPHLPFVLEVVSLSSNPPQGDRRVERSRPTLRADSHEIPVEINLWSLGFPREAPRPSIGAIKELTDSEQQLLRFDRLLSIAEAATPTAIDAAQPDGRVWFDSWVTNLRRLRAAAAASAGRPTTSTAASRVSRPLEEQLATTSERLEAWAKRAQANVPGISSEAIESIGDSLAATEGLTPRSNQNWVYCVTDGTVGCLTVDTAISAVQPTYSPIAAMLAVVCLLAVCLVAARQPAICDIFYQWPHLAPFLFGMAYWAWLQPSWLGLLIAGASVAMAFRSSWPGRAIRMEASTVLRTVRPK